MDALISVPFISYLLFPGVTSWSKSLNLLFFTMTWTTLTLSHPPLRIELISIFAIRLIFWFLPSLLTLLLDLLVPSLAQQAKQIGASALPPRNAATIGRILTISLGNMLLSIALEGVVSHGVAIFTGRSVMPVTATPPLPWTILKHIVLLFLGREIVTYYVHRHLLHSESARVNRQNSPYSFSSFSSSLLKKLSTWHLAALPHARKAPPFSLLLFADHPAVSLLLRFIPIYVPALVLRPHLLTYLAFVALVTLEEMFTHSGYAIVPGIVLGGMTRRTGTHYCNDGRGNFGTWGLLDWAHGTSVGGQDLVDDVKKEAEKHNLPAKSQRVAGDTANKMQDGAEDWKKRLRSRERKIN